MKTLEASMTTHVNQEVTTLTDILRIVRKDSVAMYFTSLDVDLVFGSNTYKSSTGFSPTSIAHKGDMSVDSLDIAGPFGILSSDDITEEDLMNGVYDEASIETSKVNYEDADADGEIKLLAGIMGRVTRERGKFKCEVRSLSQFLQQQVGEVYTSYCRADLGDARCGISLPGITVSGTVTGVTDRRNFDDDTTAGIINEVNDFFNEGLVTWTSGNNNGLTMEVKDFIQTGGQIALVQAMPKDIQTSDTFDVYPGCDKSLNDCKNKFNIVVNFRGEPYVPGNNFLTDYPDAN